MDNLELDSYMNTFEEKYNGEFSVLYHYIKDKVEYLKERELPFPYEFLFFEARYVKIYKHMKKHNLSVNKIIDIGCQLGIQSELFINEYKYIGIDFSKGRFLNIDNPKCKYIIARYPNISLDYTGAAVISSMSLGYYFKKEKEDEYYKNIVKELKKAEHLYIATDRKLTGMLSEFFNVEYLDATPTGEYPSILRSAMADTSSNLYYMKRK